MVQAPGFGWGTTTESGYLHMVRIVHRSQTVKQLSGNISCCSFISWQQPEQLQAGKILFLLVFKGPQHTGYASSTPKSVLKVATSTVTFFQGLIILGRDLVKDCHTICGKYISKKNGVAAGSTPCKEKIKRMGLSK